MCNHKRLKLALLLITAASSAITQLREGATVGNEPSQILQLNKLLRLDNNKFCSWKWPLGLPAGALSAGRTWGQDGAWPPCTGGYRNQVWREQGMSAQQGFIKAQLCFRAGPSALGWAWAGWACQRHAVVHQHCEPLGWLAELSLLCQCHLGLSCPVAGVHRCLAGNDWWLL